MENKSENGKSNGKQVRMSEEKWLQLENQFLAGTLSLREFSKIKDIPLRTLSRHSVARNWLSKLSEIQNVEKKVERLKVDKSTAVIVKKVMDDLDERGVPGDSKDLASFMNVIKTCQDLEYRRLDIPLPKQQIEMDLPDSPMQGIRKQLDEIGVKVTSNPGVNDG